MLRAFIEWRRARREWLHRAWIDEWYEKTGHGPPEIIGTTPPWPIPPNPNASRGGEVECANSWR
jgi:hypothetical protein